MTVAADTLRFEFPAYWRVAKYDDWASCKSFQRLRNCISALDLLAVSRDRATLYLIEAKDFSIHGRAKTKTMLAEAVDKVIYTLAGLLPTAVGAQTGESRHARLAMRATNLVGVFHLEPAGAGANRLFPEERDLANLKTKLEAVLGRIGMEVHVCTMANMPASLPWTVTRR